MKMKNLLINFVVTLMLGGAILGFLNNEKSSVYSPRSINSYDAKGMQEWIWNRTANLTTGEMDYEYISKVRKEIAAFNSNKSSNDFSLDWIEMGPDKVGGRTRSIIIDKNNTNILYAGAVSGGLWKSTDAGSSWKQLDSEADNLVIGSLVQTDNGNIYYGTGEKWGTYFRGAGIWMSSDNGVVFNKLSSTSSFYYVVKMVSKGNTVYAATDKGLYSTSDNGVTWTKLHSSNNAIDVKIGADGTVFAAINGKAYKSSNGDANTFTEMSGIPSVTQYGRIILAPAPSNANYIYASLAFNTYGNPFGSDYQDFDIMRSSDKGETWESIRGEYTETFQPFKHQAFYDNVIAVYPNDENKIILGGVELYSWNNISTAWEKVSTWIGDHEINYTSVYMHADLHEITFHPDYNGSSNQIVYFGNDGGVFKSENGAVTYTSLNLKYNVTQFYDIGTGPLGEIIAGSQDNGTQYNNLKGVNKERTTEISGGDGFSCDISKLNNDIKYATVYHGDLRRIVGENDIQTMNAQNKLNPFHTNFDLWESFYDAESIDSIYYTFGTDDFLFDDIKGFNIDTVMDEIEDTIISIDTLYYGWVPGDTLIGKSAAGLKPIEYILQNSDLLAGDTIIREGQLVKIHDTYQAAIAIGLNEGLRVTSLVVNLGLSEKFRLVTLATTAETGGVANNITWTSDGDIIYFSAGSKIFRLSQVKLARELQYVPVMRKSITVYNKNKVKLQQIGNFSGFSVTSIAVDPNVANNIIVTLGNFSVGSHVYYSTNAAVTNSSTTNTNFSAVQGNLPEIPAYSGLIAWNDSRKVVIGTEYGIYTTDDINASSVTWVPQNQGIQNVATYSLTQERFENSWYNDINNHGYIYAGTYGRGAFRTESNAGPVSVPDMPSINSSNTVNISNINVYPNPVSTIGNISLNLKKSSNIQIEIYNMSGQKVYNNIHSGYAGENTVQFSVAGLNSGVYFVKIDNDNNSEVKKIIVK